MSAFLMTAVEYECRVCGFVKDVYVQVNEQEDGTKIVVSHEIRLWEGTCQSCEQERVFAISEYDVDKARDGNPIDGLEVKQ